jgi:hypothetical protein
MENKHLDLRVCILAVMATPGLCIQTSTAQSLSFKDPEDELTP